MKPPTEQSLLTDLMAQPRQTALEDLALIERLEKQLKYQQKHLEKSQDIVNTVAANGTLNMDRIAAALKVESVINERTRKAVANTSRGGPSSNEPSQKFKEALHTAAAGVTKKNCKSQKKASFGENFMRLFTGMN